MFMSDRIMPKPDEAVLFNIARQLSASERRGYLRQVCAGDGALQTRLEALLRIHDEDRSFLHLPAKRLATEPPEPSAT